MVYIATPVLLSTDTIIKKGYCVMSVTFPKNIARYFQQSELVCSHYTSHTSSFNKASTVQFNV